MSMEIFFPGGVAVEAHYKGFSIRTDQPEAAGGENSAPSPFDLFLASIGTCAGYFALRFCQERQIDTAGLKLSLETERDAERHRLERVRIVVTLPAGFPERYRAALLRATDQCSVKRTLLAPPAFEITTA